VAIRLVADTNILSATITEQFLSIGTDHHLMIPDFVWMELYKSNSVEGMRQSLAIIKDFPDQIFHLKGSKSILSLDPRPAAFGNRMIWRSAGKEFKRKLQILNNAHAIHIEQAPQFKAHYAAAIEHFALMDEISAEMPQFFFDIASALTVNELKNIRRDEPYSIDVIERVLNITDILSSGFAKSKRLSVHPSTPKSYFDAYATRSALAQALFFINWVRKGNPLNLNRKKLKNDLVDRIIGTYATYFNGVLTHDEGLREAHLEQRVVLEKLGARVPRQFV
jgi:hypothetical protein